MLRIFALALSLLTPSAFASTPAYVIFGDSLSDEGRLYQLTNEQFPPSPFFEGRFSNGPLWSEYLKGARVNFAVAGAKTNYDNMLKNRLGPVVDNTGLHAQVDEYLASEPPLKELAAATVYIDIGANDFLALFEGGDTNVERLIPNAVDNITDAAKRLRTAGATKVVLIGLPNLAHIPMAKDYSLHQKQMLGIVSMKFNRLLESQADHMGFVFVDTDEFLKQVKKDSAKHGITNFRDACFDEINHIVCDNPDAYIFWDDKHPTTKVHGLFAETLQ